ncbi:MAG: EF-P beta-lysylation protein EpmB [Pirellula sp.]
MGSESSLESDSMTWQESLRRAVRSLDELLDLLQLTREQLPDLDWSSDFSLLVPHEYVRRMEVLNPSDPLLLQVLPLAIEKQSVEGFGTDPVGDSLSSRLPGVLHKYQNRALLVATGLCAVHCRYCFRRHYPYEDSPTSLQQWRESLEYIQDNPQIDEVILSGGDPLSLGNAKLFGLISEIASIEHISRIRIHTRFPVMIPNRIDSDFLLRLDALTESENLKSLWMVLHINHAQEIDRALIQACSKLRRSGAIVLNQAVLLRGINATFESQRDLCKALSDAGVIPYYLHQLDQVSGAAHFACDQRLGESIVARLRSELSGYAVPRFVKEIAGESSKTLIL